MIHQLLNLTRPLIVFDTETTGVDTSSDRIVELGFQQWTAEGLVKEWRSLINPGIPIPAAVAAIHGITDTKIQSCRECSGQATKTEGNFCTCEHFKPWPTFKRLASNLAHGFSNCDFAGKNVRFDLRILSVEFARAGVEWSYAGARVVDAERLEQLGEPRTLSDLFRKHTGQELVDAHGALVDVRASTRVIECQLQAYAILPRDLDALHEAQWPGWLDSEGKFKFVDGVPTCAFGKWNGKAMKSIDRSYWDWVLRSDFPADVKRLAGEAKLGKFPEKKL